MTGEVAQGFPAFAARRGGTRARSWWGRSWVQTLEDTSLDNGQLLKGRRYANSGQVGTITVSPGRITATVHAPEDTYESVVVVDRLSPDEWTRFLDQVGSRAGHIAALLDGEMPHNLVEAAADAEIPLLPGIGELDPSCTCDAWELPCQHAAALCYQVGWLLDEDPFVLLLIRGRSRDQLLNDLQQRATPHAAIPSPDQLPGVPATEVFRTDPLEHPLTEPSGPPGREPTGIAGGGRLDSSELEQLDPSGAEAVGSAGVGAVGSAGVGSAGVGAVGSAGVGLAGVGSAGVGAVGSAGAGSAGGQAVGLAGVGLPGRVELGELVVAGLEAPGGMEPASLALLVLDAARRARAQLRALLTGSADPWVLDEWQDAVRLAADYPVLAERLGTALGRPAELAVGISAWTYGGAPGLDVLDHPWEPDPSELARARTELLAAWDDQDLSFEISANRLTAADRQLRLDRVGRWHPYALIENTWLPAGPADRDPTAALTSSDSW